MAGSGLQAPGTKMALCTTTENGKAVAGTPAEWVLTSARPCYWPALHMLMRPAAEHHNSHHPKSPFWGSPGAGAGWSEPPTLVRGTSKVVQPRCKTLTCKRPDQVLARREVKAGRNCSPRKNAKIISDHGRYSPVGPSTMTGRVDEERSALGILSIIITPAITFGQKSARSYPR